jgi:hypothetical protein
LFRANVFHSYPADSMPGRVMPMLRRRPASDPSH